MFYVLSTLNEGVFVKELTLCVLQSKHCAEKGNRAVTWGEGILILFLVLGMCVY